MAVSKSATVRNSPTRSLQNDANFGFGTLEHFAHEWESAFALARRFIMCPEKRHYVLEERQVFASDASLLQPRSWFCFGKPGWLVSFLQKSASHSGRPRGSAD